LDDWPGLCDADQCSAGNLSNAAKHTLVARQKEECLVRRIYSLFSRISSYSKRLHLFCLFIMKHRIFNQGTIQQNRDSGGSYRSVPRLLLMNLLLAALLAGCSSAIAGSSGLAGHILAVGSTALQPLVSAAAGQFQKVHPQVQIEVRGGDSTVGL